MTKLEIIEETFNYYNSDPSLRGRGQISCLYLTKDGKMCAVGRCLQNPKVFMDEDITGISTVSIEYLDKHLKEEYRGHSIEFWIDLQCLHDYKALWNSDRMSDKGLEFYNDLIKKWK